MKHTPVKNRQLKAKELGFLESNLELRDDRRMQYLFSNFPQRESNPNKWEDLKSFWTKVVYLLLQNIRTDHTISIGINDVREWLSLKGMVPFGLETLLGILEADKKLQHITDFTAGNPSFSGSHCALSLPFCHPLTHKISSTPKAKEGKYVIIDIIKDYAEELMSHIKDSDRSSTSERVLLLSHIAKLVPAEWHLSTEDLKLVLIYLEKIDQLAIIQLNDGTVGVKLDTQVAQVSTVDRGVLAMQAVLDQLDEQVAKLAMDIEACVQQATELLKTKNRARALSHLKKNKLLQDILDKRMENIHKIQQILLSIDSASTNNQVVEAFAIGVQSLKQLNQKHTAAEVDEIMDELGNALADQAEIDTALKATDSNFDFDESELERELEALVAEDAAEKREEEGRQQEKIQREVEERKEKTEPLAFDEAALEKDLEKDLEKLEREEGERQKEDESVDALADLIGGVNLSNKQKTKQTETPMLA